MAFWLITWEWSGEHARAQEKVAAVLNSRLGHEKVREIVEFLYANASYTVSERMAIAKDKKKNPYPASYGSIGNVPYSGEIFCGHNPWLYARVVDEIKVETGADGEENVTWTEHQKPQLPQSVKDL